MAELSKFYNLTNLIMVEYIADLYNASETASTLSTEYTVYTGNDDTVYYTEKPLTSIDTYSNPLYFIKFPDASDSDYTYIGLIKDGNKYTNESIISDGIKNNTLNSQDGTGNMHYDKIRLHFIYGFLFDNLAGITLQVLTTAKYLGPVLKYSTTSKTHLVYDDNGNPVFLTEVVEATNKSTGTKDYQEFERLVYDTADLVLMDIFFPKEALTYENVVHWHTTPLYENGSFYDRYIEFYVPSAYFLSLDAASNNIKLTVPNVYGYDLDNLYCTYEDDGKTVKDYYAKPAANYDDRKITYNVLDDPTIIINFATVSEDNLTSTTQENTNIVLSSTFYQDPINLIALKYKSNSDYFNVRLIEDEDNGEIIYYPVYGEGDNATELNYEVFQQIESGVIPLLTEGFYDHMTNVNDFYDTYGDNAFKWIIYNEISVTYNYNNIINLMDVTTMTPYLFTENFTNIINYGIQNPELAGDFWKSTYRPVVKTRNNMVCKSILVSYTCRLINRLTSVEAIRRATLTLTNPSKYTPKKISLDNVVTYKIINKIQQNTISTLTVTKDSKDKIIRSYYDATNLVVKDMGNQNIYTLGLMTLQLKHSSTNYVFRLYNMNSDNIRIPYDLTGPYRYLLSFPTTTGSKILISPNTDSNALNLGIGLLVFYITEELVKRIMSVPSDERYFAIITDTDNSDLELTTLYEGKVSYYN